MKPEKVWAVFNYDIIIWSSVRGTRKDCKKFIEDYSCDGLYALGRSLFIRKITITEGW